MQQERAKELLREYIELRKEFDRTFKECAKAAAKIRAFNEIERLLRNQHPSPAS